MFIGRNMFCVLPFSGSKQRKQAYEIFVNFKKIKVGVTKKINIMYCLLKMGIIFVCKFVIIITLKKTHMLTQNNVLSIFGRIMRDYEYFQSKMS